MQTDLLDRLLVTLAVRVRSFSVCRIQQGWRLDFSPFDAITIHYVLRGSGSLQVGDGPWQSFSPHSIIIVPSRQRHVLGEADDFVGESRAEDHCALHADGLVRFTAGDGSPDTLLVCGQIADTHTGALGLFELFQGPIVEDFAANAVLQASFRLMLGEVADPGLGTQAMTEVLMKQCLILLLRQHLTAEAISSPLMTAFREPKLAPAVIAILETPGAAFTVESLATVSGMSRAAFAERFSDVFHQGPMEFVQQVRLRIAARLLGGTDLPVKVIATTIGYASRSAFSRAFEAMYAVAPSNYRRFGGQEEAEPEPVDQSNPA
ncbi:AraC family transcriptional regulator [bacterium]|nr:MAG: AraC family transcriptional regulator [bacterium]